MVRLTAKRKAIVISHLATTIRGLRGNELRGLDVKDPGDIQRVEKYLWEVAKWIEDTHPDSDF
jgi:hypothetical protein